MNSIKYENEALVITLKCSDPAALHAQLMKSITGNMNCIFACNLPQRRNVDMAPLVDLLHTILPSERELEKGFS